MVRASTRTRLLRGKERVCPCLEWQPLGSVVAGHGRSKNGVASARLCPAIHVFVVKEKQDVDHRDEPGDDELVDLGHASARLAGFRSQ